jgi:sugar lactone lactonase YvrE
MSELSADAYTRLASGIYLEGLAYDFGRDVIWYSDVIAGGIHGVKPDGTPYGSFNESRMWTGGVMMNGDGAVLSTGEGGIMWNNPDTGKSGWLLDTLEGKPINGINEMWADGTGGIYFGTNDIENIIAAKDTRPSTVYRLTVDREVIKLDEGVYFANGLAYDPTRAKFYCSDTFRTSWVWDVASDLSLRNRRVLLAKDDSDGLALDADGNVWITGFRSPGIINRVTPEGTELPPVKTPDGSTTQVRFGGADLRDFYINVVPGDGGDSLKNGEPLKSPSYLYKGRSETPGVAAPAAGFKLG